MSALTDCTDHVIAGTKLVLLLHCHATMTIHYRYIHIVGARLCYMPISIMYTCLSLRTSCWLYCWSVGGYDNSGSADTHTSRQVHYPMSNTLHGTYVYCSANYIAKMNQVCFYPHITTLKGRKQPFELTSYEAPGVRPRGESESKRSHRMVEFMSVIYFQSAGNLTCYGFPDTVPP